MKEQLKEGVLNFMFGYNYSARDGVAELQINPGRSTACRGHPEELLSRLFFLPFYFITVHEWLPSLAYRLSLLTKQVYLSAAPRASLSLTQKSLRKINQNQCPKVKILRRVTVRFSSLLFGVVGLTQVHEVV